MLAAGAAAASAAQWHGGSALSPWGEASDGANIASNASGEGRTGRQALVRGRGGLLHFLR